MASERSGPSIRTTVRYGTNLSHVDRNFRHVRYCSRECQRNDNKYKYGDDCLFVYLPHSGMKIEQESVLWTPRNYQREHSENMNIEIAINKTVMYTF